MQFKPISKEDIPVRTREGGVSTALIQGFLEAGVNDAVVDLSDEPDRTVESARATLGNYVVRHEIPVRVYTRSGQLFLERDATVVEKYQRLNAKAAAKAAAKGNGQTGPEAAMVPGESDEESE